MTPIEYFLHGQWCMYLIALSGLMLYTLLIERLCTNVYLNKVPIESEAHAVTVHMQRSDYLLFIRSLIAIIPLLGLLGTVTGMMQSFASMNYSGADIGTGISQSLVTTQYALMLAAPALLIERFVSAMIERSRVRDHILILERTHA